MWRKVAVIVQSMQISNTSAVGLAYNGDFI